MGLGRVGGRRARSPADRTNQTSGRRQLGLAPCRPRAASAVGTRPSTASAAKDIALQQISGPTGTSLTSCLGGWSVLNGAPGVPDPRAQSATVRHHEPGTASPGPYLRCRRIGSLRCRSQLHSGPGVDGHHVHDVGREPLYRGGLRQRPSVRDGQEPVGPLLATGDVPTAGRHPGLLTNCSRSSGIARELPDPTAGFPECEAVQSPP
jgi:hypothetical protein